VGGNQLPICTVWNPRRVKIWSCNPSFYHHDCRAQYVKLLIMFFFIRLPITCVLLCGNVLSAIWYQMSSICFSFFFVYLLLCCMKYLNGKVGYLALLLLLLLLLLLYTQYNNYNSNAICSLNNMCWPQQVILSLFLCCIDVHFICLLFIDMVGCACTCTAGSVSCMYKQNISQYYVMTLKLLPLR